MKTVMQSWHHPVNQLSTRILGHVALTVVSEQGLGRTLRVWAGGLRAAPAGETNATVGTAVTLTPHGHVAPIYTPLPPQKHSNLNVQFTTQLLAS